MAIKKTTTEIKKEEERYHFYNEVYDIYMSNSTNEDFISDVRANGEDVNAIFYRIPVKLLEKIKVTSQIVKA